jgi:ureidoglycolate hydrolase
MTATVTLEFRPLSSGPFDRYGEVLRRDDGAIFPAVDRGRLAMRYVSVARAAASPGVSYPPTAVRFESLNSHFSFNELLMPLSGTMGLVVAPPPGDSDAGIDYEAVAAFTLDVGDIVLLHPGTWHGIAPLTDEITLVSTTRRDDGEQHATPTDQRTYIVQRGLVGGDRRAIEVGLP